MVCSQTPMRMASLRIWNLLWMNFSKSVRLRPMYVDYYQCWDSWCKYSMGDFSKNTQPNDSEYVRRSFSTNIQLTAFYVKFPLNLNSPVASPDLLNPPRSRSLRRYRFLVLSGLYGPGLSLTKKTSIYIRSSPEPPLLPLNFLSFPSIQSTFSWWIWRLKKYSDSGCLTQSWAIVSNDLRKISYSILVFLFPQSFKYVH